MKKLIWLITLSLAAKLLYKGTFFGSGDFHVYWRAAHAWLWATGSPYGKLDPESPWAVFKYPPWILPLFAPFGVFSVSVAKFLWSVIELFVVYYSIKKIIRLGVDSTVAWGVAFCWYFVWYAQFGAGQITLFMAAAALWISPSGRWSKNAFANAFTAYLYTSKIFSMATLLGNFRQLFRAQVVAWGLALTVFPTLVVWIWMRVHDPSVSLAGLFLQFAHAANSGGTAFVGTGVRSPSNHGLTAAVLRWWRVPAENSRYDMILPLGLTLVFGSLWARFSRLLTADETWVGWIALSAVTAPLAWDHTFILDFPLCAFALDRAIRSKQKALVVLAGSGVVAVALLVPNIFGTEVVKPFDFVGAKSWGVLLSAAALVLASRARKHAALPTVENFKLP